jgi:3' terminal RNA ribose 2'-O-methyltransferase Hen1
MSIFVTLAGLAAQERHCQPMLLTITTTHTPATDLGYLLAKRPGRCQRFPLAFGQAHVFYTEADETRCTAALLLDIDPVELARMRRGSNDAPLAAYVSDRPYVASSFLSVAIAQVYGTALAGRCTARPELVQTAIPLEARLAVVPARGGEALLLRLFEPLGYSVGVVRLPLDETLPAWGESWYYSVVLSAVCRLDALLQHLYVLLPVLDREKHYYVGEAEVEKLLRHGGDWLARHPERALIAAGYLKGRDNLVRSALDRLLEQEPVANHEADDETTDVSDAATASASAAAAAVDRSGSLAEQRLDAVLAALRDAGARRVLDLGCGEGRLLARLLADSRFSEIVGVDVSPRALERARARLHYGDLPPQRRERISLLQGSLVYRDARLAGYDAAAVVEVIEHLDPSRLDAFERALFGSARPATVVLTTPNRDYNVRYADLHDGALRHADHRFEWTRAEFAGWAAGVAARHGYTVRVAPIGDEDSELGAPTQLGVFSRDGG